MTALLILDIVGKVGGDLDQLLPLSPSRSTQQEVDWSLQNARRLKNQLSKSGYSFYTWTASYSVEDYPLNKPTRPLVTLNRIQYLLPAMTNRCPSCTLDNSSSRSRYPPCLSTIVSIVPGRNLSQNPPNNLLTLHKSSPRIIHIVRLSPLLPSQAQSHTMVVDQGRPCVRTRE